MDEVPPSGEAGRSQRARIRDAALREFARHGFEGATVRGIASEAGVSAGMVQHYFPSKGALRDECDAHVLAVMREVKDLGVLGGAVLDSGFLAGTHRALMPLVPYVAMAMLRQGPAASALFSELTELYLDVLTSGELGPAIPEGEDVPAVAAVYAAMQLGLAILADRVYEQLAVDAHDRAAIARVGRARVFLAAERMIDERLEERIREGLDRYEHGQETSERTADDH